MLCVHYSIMFTLLETGQSTTLHIEQLSSYIPLELVQEDKTSHSCCLICNRKLFFVHVCYMHILRIISCYNFFASLTCPEAYFSWSQHLFPPASLPPQTPDWFKPKIIKLKIITGANWYDLQLKQIVYQLTLPKSLILKSLLEHHSVYFLWWTLHTYIYTSDPLKILGCQQFKTTN